MSSSAERAPAVQNTTNVTTRAKLRGGGGRKPIRGGKTAVTAAAAAGQFAPVREGDLNAAAAAADQLELAFGGAEDTAVAAG